MDYLLGKGASGHVEDLRHRTPIHVTCENGHEDIHSPGKLVWIFKTATLELSSASPLEAKIKVSTQYLSHDRS